MIARPVLGPAYEYRASLRRVVDGDTIDLDIDLGFELRCVTRVRLLGVDTPEVVGASKLAGLAARGFVQAWFDARDGEVLVRTHKPKLREKYGRWLAEVWSCDGEECLSSVLIARGHAREMEG